MRARPERRLAWPLGVLVFAALSLLLAAAARAADIDLPGGVSITTRPGTGETEQVATAIKLLVGLTVISLAPAFMIAVTSFTRIVIVLAMIRHALGMQDVPPTTVIVTLALFLTLFTMMPVFQQVNESAYQPYVAGKLGTEQAFEKGMAPLRDFMIRQTREQDLGLMIEISKSPRPETLEDIGSLQLIPAFMLSELRSALQIGFVVFLPFLLIDLVVSSVLMSMGMFMVPPVMISLPLKVLMFVLIDGWNLVVRSLIGSFH